MVRSAQKRRWLFSQGFEADLPVGELASSKRTVRKTRELVCREELRQRLWPTRTHVDFDRNLITDRII